VTTLGTQWQYVVGGKSVDRRLFFLRFLLPIFCYFILYAKIIQYTGERRANLIILVTKLEVESIDLQPRPL